MRPLSGYRHRMHVRIGGLHGARGLLLRCDKRDGSGVYWKVRLHDGTWVWPDRLVVDGCGDHLHDACAQCDLPFIGAPGDLICAQCTSAIFGAAVRVPELPPDSTPAPRLRNAHRRRRAHF